MAPQAPPAPPPHAGLAQLVAPDVLLGRWRLTMDLFGRVFCEDVGAEPGSVIAELGGFPVKVPPPIDWQLGSVRLV